MILIQNTRGEILSVDSGLFYVWKTWRASDNWWINVTGQRVVGLVMDESRHHIYKVDIAHDSSPLPNSRRIEFRESRIEYKFYIQSIEL